MNTKLTTTTFTNATSIANNFMPKEGDNIETLTFSYESENCFIIRASDFIESIELKVECTELEEFDTFSLNGKKLLASLRKIRIDELLIESTDQYIVLKHGKREMKIEKFASYQEFIFDSNAKDSILLDDSLLEAFRLSEHAVSSDLINVQLGGVHLESDDNNLYIASSDTKRLAVQTVNNVNVSMKSIIPKKAIRTILKNFTNSHELKISETEIFIKNETMHYSSKKLNGKFPDYQKIIPQSFNKSFTIGRKFFLELLKDATVFEEKVLILINNDEIKIVDDEKECVIIEPCKTGDTHIEFKVNAKYIIDYLMVVSDDSIDIMINEANLPFALKSKNSIEMIMPLTEDKRK